MKLQEKFLPFIDDVDLINDIPNEKWGLRNANKCVEVADDFAIEFANWINNKVVNPNGIHHNLLGTTRATQLLPIFKKEKGL